MKDTRPFEGIIPEQVSDQTGLSILSCNAGFKRGEVTNSVVVSYHCDSTPSSKVALS